MDVAYQLGSLLAGSKLHFKPNFVVFEMSSNPVAVLIVAGYPLPIFPDVKTDTGIGKNLECLPLRVILVVAPMFKAGVNLIGGQLGFEAQQQHGQFPLRAS